MTDRFQVSAGDEEGRSVVKVAGAVDLETSPRLWEVLAGAMRGASGAVSVDLGSVTYMDSSGVATLVKALKTAKRSSLDFRLQNPSDSVMAVLDLAQLRKVFVIDEGENVE